MIDAYLRYLNTGVLFVRVRNDAVAQLERWVAIMDSGVIQCHAWDQAGLQWMFAHAVNPDFSVSTECKPPQCGEKPGGQFWSCTPAYELQVEQRFVALPMLPHSSAPNACSCVSCHIPTSTKHSHTLDKRFT
jgi:hypothetical protein